MKLSPALFILLAKSPLAEDTLNVTLATHCMARSTVVSMASAAAN